MNAYTVGRHVKLPPRANSSQTSRPSPALSLPTTLVTDLRFIGSVNSQLQLGEQADHQPRRLRLKARDFLPFPEGDIKKYKLIDPALQRLAPIVRGADTDAKD